MSLRQDLRERLDHELVSERLRRIEAAKTKAAGLRRELEELGQRVPLWDRVLFFGDTPDERLQTDRAGSLATVEKVLVEMRAELLTSLEKVGREFPPFGVAMEIERCFKVARDGLAGGRLDKQRELHDALGALAERIVSTWVPDFDPPALFAALSEEAACRRAAKSGNGAPADHARLGVVPVTNRQLVPLIAARLLKGEFFSEQATLRELEGQRSRLEAQHHAAAKSVRLRDKLNVFSESPEQQRESELRIQLQSIEEQLQRRYERTRRLLHQALGAYAPLAVYQRIFEVLGVVGMLEVEPVTNLGADGEVVARRVIVGRALAYRALQRLLQTFLEMFPDVPVPLALNAHLSDTSAGKVLSPRELLFREFEKQLDASWAASAREEALGHATMRGILSQKVERVRAQIGMLDRLIFFVDSAKDEQVERLEERAEWHDAQARRLWNDILGAARITGAKLAPLAVRDLATEASALLSELRTEGGTSATPLTGTVIGRDVLLRKLDDMQGILSEHYGLGGSREAIMERVADHPPIDGDPPPRRRFEILEPDEVVRRLALRLQDTGFDAAFTRLREARSKSEERRGSLDEAGEPISLWDSINVLTTSADQERDELQEAVAELGPELQADMERVNGLFQQALREVYPPALLGYSLGGVRSAVLGVRSVCRAHTARIPTSASGRVERRYVCELQGKRAAVLALRGWCRELVATYGQLPDYPTLMAEVELGGVLEAGWQWD